MNFGCGWWFVGAVDAREVDELAAACFGIEAFHVAPLAFLQRRIDKDFDELSAFEQPARHFPLGAIGRNKRDDNDQSGIHQKLGDLGDPTNVFDAISLGESKIPIQTMVMT